MVRPAYWEQSWGQDLQDEEKVTEYADSGFASMLSILFILSWTTGFIRRTRMTHSGILIREVLSADRIYRMNRMGTDCPESLFPSIPLYLWILA